MFSHQKREDTSQFLVTVKHTGLAGQCCRKNAFFFNIAIELYVFCRLCSNELLLEHFLNNLRPGERNGRRNGEKDGGRKGRTDEGRGERRYGGRNEGRKG